MLTYVKCLANICTNKDTSLFCIATIRTLFVKMGARFLPKVSKTYKRNTTIQLEYADEHSTTIRDTRHASKLKLGGVHAHVMKC